MSTKALGSWRKPPLAYVVAELVISPYYSMASKVSGLQDRLRTLFPKTIEAKEVIFESDKPTTQSMWQLLSADQMHGVLIGTRAIALHATSYDDSADFLGRWADVLDAIKDADLGAFVERAGLRYVDLIVPSGERTPADYVASSLQGISPKGSRLTGSFWAAAFQFDGTVVNLHVGAPAPKGMVLPPGFTPLPLTKPSIMVEAERRLKDNLPIGFADTDCIRDVNKVFDAGELVSVYSEMQKLTSLTFKATLSDSAQKEWK